MKSLLTAALLAAPLPAVAQDHVHHQEQPALAPSPAQPEPIPDMPAMDHQNMPGMDHDMRGMGHRGMAMPGTDDGGPAAASEGSGTSRLPGAEGGMHGLHLSTGDWMVMAHGDVWGVYTDQSGPRGDDKAFVASMAMLTAERDFGGAKLQLKSMWSLDPLMGQRGYPNIFATGETAHGVPLVDRQHPHDLFMELAARVDVPLGGGVTGFLYGGPVGEPALGPSAFMHRASAAYFPLSPIGHHWFDSTHITYGVATAGLATDHVQLEGSAFRGREPDEHRWDLETPKLDSWSVRATWTPSPNWAVQLSHGRLKSPEETHPGEDEARTTATAHYASGGLRAMLGFAAKNRVPGPVLTAWIGEASWDIDRHHSIFGRIENVANDELFPDHADPLHDMKFRVTRLEGGYAYRLPVSKAGTLALGGVLSAYAKPAALDAAYGDPFGYTLFAKFSLGQ